MKFENTKADFCITIDFEKGSKDPSRVFRAASDMIEAFKEFDHALVSSIHANIEPVLVLEEVETGSLKIWLRNRLEDADDEALKNCDWKPIVGSYLVKCKHRAVDFLNKRNSVESRKELEILQEDMLEIAKETDITMLPSYTPVPLPKIVDGIEGITKAIQCLSEHDEAHLTTAYGQVDFNQGFTFIPEQIEELITEEMISSTSTMVIKVKKPDYLGASMWDFRHGQIPFSAKIRDAEWLHKFQNRKVDIRPGDALRAQVEVIARYDTNMELVSQTYTVLKVYNVIAGLVYQQEEIPE